MIIQLIDILDYAICPWKLAISGKPPRDSRQIKYYVLSDLVRYYLACSYRNTPPSEQLLRTKLGTLWHNYTKDLTDPVSSQDMLKIAEDVRYISDVISQGSELVAVNYPISVAFGSDIVTHNLDAIFLKNNTIEVFNIDVQNNIYRTKSDIDLSIITALAYKVVNLDLRVKELTFGFYKPISRSTLYVDYNPKYLKIVETLIKGIKDKIFYPRPINSICNTCMKKELCEFV